MIFFALFFIFFLNVTRIASFSVVSRTNSCRFAGDKKEKEVGENKNQSLICSVCS